MFILVVYWLSDLMDNSGRALFHRKDTAELSHQNTRIIHQIR